jgi:hypothetical protein
MILLNKLRAITGEFKLEFRVDKFLDAYPVKKVEDEKTTTFLIYVD